MVGSRFFTLFHFSMLPVKQLDIETERLLDREEWMRFSLSKPFEFTHRGGQTLFWTPREIYADVIVGLIQKQAPHTLHLPPNEGGEEFVTEEWQGTHVLIDPTSHEHGQRIAVENDVVGTPRALMASLQKALNLRVDRPFQIEIDPIFDPRSFWSFINEHGGMIQSVSFNFVTPNMWGTKKALDAELAATREETGAERVVVALSSENGLDGGSERVRDGVEYTERGGGSVKAKSLDGDRYSSDASAKRTELKDVVKNRGLGIEFIREMSGRILGRE